MLYAVDKPKAPDAFALQEKFYAFLHPSLGPSVWSA